MDSSAAPITLDNVASLPFFAPELALMGAVLLVIIWDLAVRDARLKIVGSVAICVTALGYSAVSAASFLAGDFAAKNLFGGIYVPEELAYSAPGLLAFDDFTNTFRILFAVVSAIILVFVVPPALSAEPSGAEKRNVPEMLSLLMVLAAGMNMMAASRSLLMIYLSLEMVSVISFVLAGFKLGNRKSSEGALKYVIYGGVASGVMLYGMSWIYGLTGSLNLGEIYTSIAALTVEQGSVPEAVFVGVVCMLVGFGYKVSAAPFHMWTPDVYEGAPTPVTAFLSVGPKAAGLAMLLRFFHDALGADAPQLLATAEGVAPPWPIIGGCLAMATMTIGNLTALNQDNVKRMLAYSSIAHAGYMLMAFSVFSHTGMTAMVFYAITYCLMNLGAFLVVMALAEVNGGDESIHAFKGLGQRAPVVALAMTMFLVSLAGIPPMAGFVGKFYLFKALVEVGGEWNWVIAVVGVLNSVISLFYYARIVRAMYLESADGGDQVDVRKVFGATTVVLAVPTLLLGIYWAPLYDFVEGSLSMVAR